MSAESSVIAGVAVAGTTVVVLLCSLLLLIRLGRVGNLERALAHTLVDATSRRSLIVSLSTLAGAFVTLGIVTALGNANLLADDVTDALSTAIFCSGAVALLFMVRAGFQVSRITLADELNLRDFEPDVYRALILQSTIPGSSTPSLYVSPALDSEPAEGPTDARVGFW